MASQLRRIVEAESPSDDLVAIRRCAGVIAGILKEATGIEPELLETERRVHLLWRRGPSAKVLVLAHMDTVWPLGTTDRWPFVIEGDIASGPGVFDMKAGIVQAIAALSMTGVPGIAFLVTSDEETGSASSRETIETLAREAGTVLVAEPSERGALKIARKGSALYDIEVNGRAAHAGLEPERGVNATIESAHLALQLAQMGDRAAGTTVTPTTLVSGRTGNVIPESASLHVDLRAWSKTELERVDREIRELRPTLPGASIRVLGGINRGPLARSASEVLFGVAQECAADIGLSHLEGVEVGGSSDGNFAAHVGAATLDGLGAVGGGAHSRTEHVVLSAMADRAALLAALLECLPPLASNRGTHLETVDQPTEHT
jgi:glutamate carboxypeptidase